MNVLRWSAARPPHEEELLARMKQEGLTPYRWSNGPGDTYTVHSHTYEKVLYCAHGSICFVLPDLATDERTIDLAPGDCMVLPPGVRHSAVVGPQGVVCLEATRPARKQPLLPE